MTNEEKAREIASYRCTSYSDYSFTDCAGAALDAMQWKDEQYAKEKQQWIEKACEWLNKNANSITGLSYYFKKSMEE